MSTTAVASTVRHVVVDTPVGELTVVRDDHGLTGIYFPEHWSNPDRSLHGQEITRADGDGFEEAVAQLGEYFAGERRGFDLSLHPQGSSRARRVWQLISEIPYGSTTTYGALAKQVGDGTSARAIGGYVGHNPLSIIVPCHRVVGSTGKLTGYAGGLARKQHLLELEGALPLW